ncbi:MAG: hypothetical protein GY866_24110, partial [Proteobacteria bacterium]|nr:hypothetical protein [Pseudomonadota bacterium]
METPLPERIGRPELFVGRQKEFADFNKWLRFIPKSLSKSRVILARRKSGKTAFVQRIFNNLWNQNGDVVPFYYSFPEKKMWYPYFALEYYCTFVSHYISFIERDPTLIRSPLSPEKIREYGSSKGMELLVDDVDLLLRNQEAGVYDYMWRIAYTAPERFAGLYDKKVLVIIDEFQYIVKYVYSDQNRQVGPDETLAGSFHDCVESKEAPMLVTGSYVGWLTAVIDRYLEAGRLKRFYMNPYLAPEEGLQAVYRYAEFYDEPITNETAAQINRLCLSDPFFISCVVQSGYENRDLTTQSGVVDTVNYEIANPKSEMSMTWREYIEMTLQRLNDRHAKSMLLHVGKNADREWTPPQLKETLQLDIDTAEIRKKLEILVKADVMAKGFSDIRYRGRQDGTLSLVLRSRFEEEINDFVPDLKKEILLDPLLRRRVGRDSAGHCQCGSALQIPAGRRKGDGDRPPGGFVLRARGSKKKKKDR